MTVSSVLNRVNYDGNSVTQIFAVSFPFRAAADLIVLSTVIATGIQTTKTITTHYTISGTPDALGYYSNGGSVTMLVAPASTERLTIYRDPPRLQGLDLTANDNLPAENVEAQFDYLTMLVQRVSDLIGRSLRQPDGDSENIGTMPSKVERVNTIQGYDANGDPIPVTAAVNTANVSAFMATVLDDTTAAAAAITLGVLRLSGGTLTGALTSSKAAVTGYTRVTPNYCKAILPIIAAYTPSASCAGHVLDANLPTNALVAVKVQWRTKSNNAAGNRVGLTNFSGSSSSCAAVTATSTFQCTEQAAVAAGTVIAEGSDIVYVTTLAGTLYSADLNAGGNGTSYIASIEALGYYD